MKVLFINPPDELKVPAAPDEEGQSFLDSDKYGNFPPLGMLYVLSYLEKEHPAIEIIYKDCIAEHVSHEELKRIVEDIQPDVVGITSFTISLVDVCMVARNVRAIKPDAFIALGGHHPIAFPREAAKLPHFDCIVVGEGEIPFSKIITALKEGKKEAIAEITGVYTAASIKKWENMEFIDKRLLKSANVPVSYVEDLSTLPIPNRNYITNIDYNSVVGKHDKLATILTSRGCPYLCTFCDVPYKKYRTRTMESVVDEIEVCLDLGYKEFHFYDDLFNVTPSKVINFCDEVERRGLRITWDFRGRVNACTQESLARAKKAGLRMISFGVETGSNEGLKYLKKGTTVERIEQAFKWCRELGILTIADFIIGFPFEKTREDIMNNLRFLQKIDPDYALIQILQTLPNTPLYEEAVKRGIVDGNAWYNYVLNPTTDFRVTHWEEHFTVAELAEIHKEAYRMFYFRPKRIVRNIVKTRTLHEFKKKLKGAFTLLRGSTA